MIKIKKFTFNPIQENTYLLFDETRECIIVDAGCYFDYEKKELDRFILENGLNPVLLVNTHCHFDHLLGVNHCRYKYKTNFLIPEGESSLVEHLVVQSDLFGVPTEPVDPADGELKEGGKIQFGNSELEIIKADGHSPGGLVFYHPGQKFLLAGDVLFYGSIGRTDLPGGSYERLANNIRTKLLVLPPETTVYCGHGPETTIGFEKKSNPFLTD
ncbi:MAG: hypothetical protein A2W90_13320 [Bacteroidetes bacterium GWF2_42_66]|nr:MAG: hypothetical protein A2W92_14035 [Bacteroidetes bacterium GWA2_42_15]OFX97251.1 MAG: hypothetical protein A2W89_00495 [Bacteroidetes bacterium GWE2_42_39]OFY39888.1 MAG: hypothetical protein A2W90_13320 [Bacteroidetes bacterium GWF2_42_66]HBL78063.1 MBL fold hydrolase [Prolixibacteraceae bacterium]HCU61237.1 MBL fold hydrolase [Prolixibacteraceae bacterium]